ncbi:MAG: hypothetical protein IPH28_13145 [Cytophagaceae bacterium]|nr:hypothetical protein [Cytophagaceae bacterium]
MKKIVFAILVSFIMISCKTTETDQVVTIEKKFSLTLPSFLSKSTELNEDATLQYQNMVKEFYVVVIEDTKSEMKKSLEENNLTELYPNDINGYSCLLVQGLEKNMKITKKTALIDTVVNNMPAKHIRLSGKVEGLDAFYSVAFVEGKDTYYQVMAWTLANKEAQYTERMNKIIHSLKEL